MQHKEIKMVSSSRRKFLGDVGTGMLLASLGSALASDLGITLLHAEDSENRLHFGEMEPLVALMQETEAAKLTALMVEKLKSGTDLKTLVTAGALANARTFGGHDYIGFHTFMAFAPAYRMALELPAPERPLPVLKVLHRNATRIQEFGGRKAEILHPVSPRTLPAGSHGGEYLREISRTGDIDGAERVFASIAQSPSIDAFNHLQLEVDDEVDVHRIVLSWRAWDTLEFAGQEWAQTLLRQSVRYCARTEMQMIERKYPRSTIRTVLPALLDQYKLMGRQLGQKSGDDLWLSQLANTIFRGSRDQAADAVAQSLTEGFAPEHIGEAISVAANMLVLHDPGRPEKWATAEKPVGSCHGDSVGVHASDAANAWRNIARISDSRNLVSSLIVGAFHTGGQSDRSNPDPFPFAEQLAEIQQSSAAELLSEAETAIKANEQFRAAAVIAKYGLQGFDAQPVFNMLLKFATSEDGALHAEKYYHTARAEYASTRAPFRWRQLVALARVTASQFGHKSTGFEEAKKLLQL